MEKIYLFLLFLVVAFISLMAMPALFLFILIGISVCLYIKLKGKETNGQLFNAGVILLVSPLLTLIIVAIFMSAPIFG